MRRQTLSHALKFKVALIIICLFVCVGAAAVGARHLLTLSAAEDAAAAAPIPLTAAARPQEDEGGEKVKAVVFNLRPEGFEPAEVMLAAGEYLLVFNNRTGLDEFALRMEREGHGTMREAHPHKLKREWRQLLRLTPGTYVVTELNHPEWTLRVTVTPR